MPISSRDAQPLDRVRRALVSVRSGHSIDHAPHPSPRPIPRLTSPLALVSIRAALVSTNSNDNDASTVSILTSKSKLKLGMLSLVFHGFQPNSACGQELELERYTDSKEGFTLLKPSSYLRLRHPSLSLSHRCTVVVLGG